MDCGESCCKNTIMEEVGLLVPRILHHLIQRPLQHLPIAAPLGVPDPAVYGMVIMEFDKQIFRRDIEVPREEKSCKTCGRPGRDLQTRYAEAVEKAAKGIARDVRKVMREKLSDALSQIDPKVGS